MQVRSQLFLVEINGIFFYRFCYLKVGFLWVGIGGVARPTGGRAGEEGSACGRAGRGVSGLGSVQVLLDVIDSRPSSPAGQVALKELPRKIVIISLYAYER